MQCAFCGGLSPYNHTACLSCREPFAGAPQRKAAWDAEIARQRGLQTVRTVGGVAAPFVGAMAGGMVGGWAASHWGHPAYYGGGYGSGFGYGGYDGGSSSYDSNQNAGGAMDFGTSGIATGGDDGGGFFDAISDFGGSDFGGGDSGGGSDT